MSELIVLIYTGIFTTLIPIIFEYYNNKNFSVEKAFFDNKLHLSFLLKSLLLIILYIIWIEISYSLYFSSSVFDFLQDKKNIFDFIATALSFLILIYLFNFLIQYFNFKKKSFGLQIVEILNTVLSKYSKINFKKKWIETNKIIFSKYRDITLEILFSKQSLSFNDIFEDLGQNSSIIGFNENAIQSFEDRISIVFQIGTKLKENKICCYYKNKKDKNNLIKALRKSIEIGDDFDHALQEIFDCYNNEIYRCYVNNKLNELDNLLQGYIFFIHKIIESKIPLDFYELSKRNAIYFTKFTKFNNEIKENRSKLNNIALHCSLFPIKYKSFDAYVAFCNWLVSKDILIFYSNNVINRGLLFLIMLHLNMINDNFDDEEKETFFFFFFKYIANDIKLYDLNVEKILVEDTSKITSIKNEDFKALICLLLYKKEYSYLDLLKSKGKDFFTNKLTKLQESYLLDDIVLKSIEFRINEIFGIQINTSDN